jgi:Domain of unknown function (DUF4041)/Meiotically up-regulated gene 113
MAYLYYSTRVRLDAYKPIQNLNKEIKQREESLSEAKTEHEELKTEIAKLSKELAVLNEESHLTSSGFFKAKYDFKISKEFEDKLQEVRQQQKLLIQNSKAIVSDTEWMVSGSKALGKKMTDRNVKLGLSAFNAQCDNEILKVQFSTIDKSEDKISQIRDGINKLLEPNSLQITDNFYHLKLEELHLVFSAQERIKKDQDEQRLKLAKLKAAEENPGEHGFIYILSNIGVLGEDVYKIGMTKKLDPIAHIHQMSDDNLPYDFDIHAVIQSDEAASVLNLLHQELAPKRLNKVNLHKDFFKANLGEIEVLCRKHLSVDFKLNPTTEAKDWRQTVALSKSEKKKAA